MRYNRAFGTQRLDHRRPLAADAIKIALAPNDVKRCSIARHEFDRAGVEIFCAVI